MDLIPIAMYVDSTRVEDVQESTSALCYTVPDKDSFAIKCVHFFYVESNSTFSPNKYSPKILKGVFVYAIFGWFPVRVILILGSQSRLITEKNKPHSSCVQDGCLRLHSNRALKSLSPVKWTHRLDARR